MSFAGAPVTRGLIVCLCGASVAAAVLSRQYLFNVPLVPHLTRDHQLWRLVAHHAAFSNSSDLFISVLLLYYTAIPVERNFGTHKYASFLLVVAGLSTVLELFALVVGYRFGFHTIPAGPLAVVFAVFFQARKQVPTLFYFKVFGIEVSNRIARYILVAQPPASLVLAAIGVLSSQLYLSNFMHMRQYRISPRLTDVLARLLKPLSPGMDTAQRSALATQQDLTAASPGVTLANGGMLMRSAWMGAGAGAATTTQAQAPGRATPATGNRPANANDTTDTGTTAAIPLGPAGAQTRAPGLVQAWAGGLTGQQQMPSAQQISELSAIFPDTPRDSVVAALQRNNLDVSRAAESLLSG